jgi:cleavage and polyadenylation specificity factor subunit 2
MDTVRLEGSVLIPIETVSRTLELIYILGKFWEEKKLGGMYHLVFLSPMAHNIIEYAKSQLEWMPDSLSKDFFFGRANPFSLAHLHTCSSVDEVMAVSELTFRFIGLVHYMMCGDTIPCHVL